MSIKSSSYKPVAKVNGMDSCVIATRVQSHRPNRWDICSWLNYQRSRSIFNDDRSSGMKIASSWLDYFYNHEPVNDFLREIDRKVENKYVSRIRPVNAYARKQSGFDLSPMDKSNSARSLLLFMEFALRYRTLFTTIILGNYDCAFD